MFFQMFFWEEVPMTVGDIVRKAEWSIQLNTGNISLLGVNIEIKGVLEKGRMMMYWKEQKGEAEPHLS